MSSPKDKNMQLLRLGENLWIDISEAVAKDDGLRFSLLGKSGSGKTNTLFVLAEEGLAQGWPLIIIDPMKNFRHLRSLPYPVIVAGNRKSADVRLTTDNAAVLAEWVFEQRVSVVIDTGMYEPGEDMQVVAAFLRRFWRLVLEQDEDAALKPYVLMIDEAQLFVPQGSDTLTSGLLKDLGKRGRQMNVWMFTATQRAAAVDKDFLTQVNALICHRVMMGLDSKVVAESVSMSPKTVMGIMRKMHKGEALVIADPELLDFGEDDYLLAQVRATSVQYRRRARTDTEAESPPLRVIDPAMIEALRMTMAESAPDADDATGAEMEAELTATIERQAIRIRELEAEVKLLRELTPSPDPLPVHGEGEKTVLAANGHVAVTVSAPVLTPQDDWDGRSQLATTRAINRQQRDFEALVQRIKDYPVMHRRLLMYLTQREGQQFPERELARFTGHSLATLQKRRPTGIERLGLIQRNLSKDRTTWVYQSNVRPKLAELYPDLNIDALVSTISQLEKV